MRFTPANVYCTATRKLSVGEAVAAAISAVFIAGVSAVTFDE